MAVTNWDTQIVARCGSLAEGLIARGFLESRGVRAFLPSENYIVLHGGFFAPYAPANVLALGPGAAVAQALLGRSTPETSGRMCGFCLRTSPAGVKFCGRCGLEFPTGPSRGFRAWFGSMLAAYMPGVPLGNICARRWVPAVVLGLFGSLGIALLISRMVWNDPVIGSVGVTVVAATWLADWLSCIAVGMNLLPRGAQADAPRFHARGDKRRERSKIQVRDPWTAARLAVFPSFGTANFYAGSIPVGFAIMVAQLFGWWSLLSGADAAWAYPRFFSLSVIVSAAVTDGLVAFWQIGRRARR